MKKEAILYSPGKKPPITSINEFLLKLYPSSDEFNKGFQQNIINQNQQMVNNQFQLIRAESVSPSINVQQLLQNEQIFPSLTSIELEQSPNKKSQNLSNSWSKELPNSKNNINDADFPSLQAGSLLIINRKKQKHFSNQDQGQGQDRSQ